MNILRCTVSKILKKKKMIAVYFKMDFLFYERESLSVPLI